MKYLALAILLSCGVDAPHTSNGLQQPPDRPSIEPTGITPTGDITISWGTYLQINKYLIDSDDWMTAAAAVPECVNINNPTTSPNNPL